MAYTLKINGKAYGVDVDGDTPLLWVLRDVLGIKTHEGKDDGIGHEPRADAFKAEGCGRGHYGRGGEGSALDIDCAN